MEASIRPLHELDPDGWLTLINKILDRMEPLVPHMRLPLSTREHLMLLRETLGATFRPKVYRNGKESGLNVRVQVLGSLKFETWDNVFLALDDKGGLRVIQVSAASHVYDSDLRSGDYILWLLAASDLNGSGCNILGMEVVTELLKIMAAAELLKFQHYKSMAKAHDDLRSIVVSTVGPVAAADLAPYN